MVASAGDKHFLIELGRGGLVRPQGATTHAQPLPSNGEKNHSKMASEPDHKFFFVEFIPEVSGAMFNNIEIRYRDHIRTQGAEFAASSGVCREQRSAPRAAVCAASSGVCREQRSVPRAAEFAASSGVCREQRSLLRAVDCAMTVQFAVSSGVSREQYSVA